MRASRTIAHPPERVFQFLSDVRNHWRLEDAFIALGEVHAGGGRIRICGPLGIGRDARTTVVEAVPPRLMRGRAEVGRRTVGIVEWTIEPANGGSRVFLAARVEHASPADRALLALGGARWLRRRFARVLEHLEAALA